ncbi:preprotein translocase subunit SecA [Granulosicoccus antarcticus]|uniref:Protein translocase subunit SecA n=1 Tax=Granulosicoccus antarcticus IMCC3135 TaxID=1192854 RepID=A0A2Z2P132_9GAMM|nr:preprotein translocase subunit SecA [Granulosicoccus antarcticus]ASJ75878.1 Protein translocase subunit SecA [Granulosicoccus antarcticus IMCC3135]
MLANLVKKIVGSSNDRTVKRLTKNVDAINAHEAGMQSLTDEDLAAKTVEFRERIAAGATLESLLPEAFAVAREAGKRALGMRHFDVQLIGGMVLNNNKIAEMRTGEGKTLVATSAVYLNALAGKGVHVITVNDYLAQRDAEWMTKLYGFLGLSVGIIVGGLATDARRAAYACDITYGTNNEFGFDYLRDNMAHSPDQRVQRGLNYAIIDEVDSILIDEARTPLIISGPADGDSALYDKLDAVVPILVRAADEESEGDYSVDEKGKQVHLTESGMERVEEILTEQEILAENSSLYDSTNIAVLHHLNAALRAHSIYRKDIDYIVSNDQIVIVDEFTGRTMPGRRWSEGLHQAIESKEKVTIQRENQTLASITFQNYFRLYEKLAGMTGTADTEAFEFQSIYGLEVVVIPTHRPMVRNDKADLVFLTQREKYDAIIEDIEDCAKRQQPVLVGTTSIETSEYLSGLLKQKDIKHEVLNAKQHEREANIIENAGRPGAVTIATNMAGRGTDIVLGGSLEAELSALITAAGDAATAAESSSSIKGEWQKRHDEVLTSGGLHIIGTERHESRRIDNQLRGRSGRQGDPGSTRFYLSLEDSLMRIFASERVSNLMQKLGMEEGEAIEHPWVTKAIENAQRKVEGHNFDMRKNLLEYDDVANDQRKVVYEQRNELMETENMRDLIDELREEIVPDIITRYIPPNSLEEVWDLDGLQAELKSMTNQDFDVKAWLVEEPNLPDEDITVRIMAGLVEDYDNKESTAGAEGLRNFERYVSLQALDDSWKEHLAGMDYLRQSVGLRGYAQKNPKQEYKREAFELFTTMLGEYKAQVVTVLSKVQVRNPEQVEEAQAQAEEARQAPAQSTQVSYEHREVASALSGEAEAAAIAAAAAARDAAVDAAEEDEAVPAQPVRRDEPKVGRNEPCPCGSGKKYKNCHGKLA